MEWFEEGLDADHLTEITAKGWNKPLTPDVARSMAQAHRAATQLLGVPTDQLMRVPKDASDPLYPTISAFLKQYHAMRGAQARPTANTIPVADAILLTAAVTKDMGGKVLDKAALRDAIEGAHGVAGLQGFWTFSPTDHGTSFSDGVVVVRYDNGEWKLP